MNEKEERIVQFAEASKNLRNEFLEKMNDHFFNELNSILMNPDADECIAVGGTEKDHALFTPIETKFLLELFWLTKITNRISTQILAQEVIIFERNFIGIRCFSGYLARRGFKESFIVAINPQKIVEIENLKYRIDFEFIAMPDNGRDWNVAVCVELDGHDFHEKNKDQAKRDKQRDRELQKYGYHVIHYTGSEVWIDPQKVVKDVFDCLLSLMIDKLATIGLCQRYEATESARDASAPF